ncbi:MAG: tetratricopeptide repeat protein [Balneolaceae bacterium]|nr:tetratricopeptide repeat protein [Balneolaceae bacterium]
MKKLSLLILLCVAIFSVSVFSQASDEDTSTREQLVSIKQQLTTAVNIVDRQEIARIAYGLNRFFEDQETSKYARYYAAYAWYRLGTLPTEDGSEPKSEWLDTAVDHLKKAIETDRDFAEAHALLSSVYGMKASGVFSGMKYGPKAQSAIDKSIALSPYNPRIYLIDGIGTFFKPSMFGGGTDKALKLFQKSASLFDEYQPASALAPSWGHAEVYAWIGQVYEKKEQIGKAKEAYQKALDIDPNYGWVKYSLLPGLTSN